MRTCSPVAFLACLLALAGCTGGGESGEPPRAGSAVAAPSPAALPARVVEPRSPVAPPSAGEVMSIPRGVVRAGSVPGTQSRDPTVEVDLLPIDVAAFRIDRLPYPNDPALPPRTDVTREQAQALCAADGKRLCHELEWERACEGDSDATFPGGETFDLEACGLDPGACASPFGVLSMGATLREWTASDATLALGDALRTAVVRGAAASADAAMHRCAARAAAAPGLQSATLGFRCCAADAPAGLVYPIERDRPMFAEQKLELAELRRVLGSMPELARFARTFMPFDEEEVDRALARGATTRTGIAGWTIAKEVLVWSPRYGDEVWVVAGAAEGSAIVAAFYPLPDGTFRHASSFVLADEPLPVAIAYSPGSQRELLWSACWGCGGEGGAITYRDDTRVVVVQR